MPERRSCRFAYASGSPRRTHKIAELIGRRVDAGACIALSGTLGAGKTVFVRGICRGLGIDEDVVSPTFVLCEEFEGRRPVVHVDLYRLEHEREIEELGLFDMMGTDRILLVEWGDRSGYLHDAADIAVHLSFKGSRSRTIEVACLPEYARWFEEMEPDE